MDSPQRAQDIRVGPWRRFVLWYTIGPLLALLLVLAAGASPAERRALLISAGIVTAVLAPVEWMIRRTRLEIDAASVRIVQTGYILEAPTAELSGVRLHPGHEGLVTQAPISGKGAQRLAGVRGLGLNGALLFDTDEQALLAARRYLPLAAFAWHLRHGDLRQVLSRVAPQLAADFELQGGTLATQPGKPLRLLFLLVLCGTLIAMGAALGAGSDRLQAQVLVLGWAVLAPLLSLRAVVSARNSWRAGSRLLAALFAALALVMLGWALVSWSQVAAVLL